MSADAQPVAEAVKPLPQSQRFRPSVNRVNLTSDQRRRQASVMGLAWSVFRSRDDVMLFFNRHSDVLAARPLDLALSSDDGLRSVETELRIRQTQGSEPADAPSIP